MTIRELRQKYLAYFESKGHLHHASGSLVPIDVTGREDNSLLFNGAGMVQFKPYFRGAATPPHPRLVTCQKCLRTGDIEEVGDDTHLTFFEMLGNFSFGDYFKVEAIAYSWEFLTGAEWLHLDPKKLSFTVFSEDDEAFAAWSKHLESAGIEPATRIFRLGEDTNYWPAGAFSKGPPGPCGPNSEMFYWTGAGDPPTGPYSAEDYLRDESQGLWLEIWNDVFISSEWQGELKNPARPDEGWRKTGMPDLPFRSIDTGMGLERTSAVLGGFKSVYDTDAFQPLFRVMESLAPGLTYGADKAKTKAMRVVADHARAAVFCISDGILPSNTGRGYVLRRLLRRAALKVLRVLGISGSFLAPVAAAIIDNFGSHYQELNDRKATILETLRGEEQLFAKTLEEGTRQLEEIIRGLGEAQVLPGERAFFLYDTFGFPREVTEELALEAGLTLDREGFESAMIEAQERSRGASGMGSVYGGVESALAGASATEFVGYSLLTAKSTIQAVSKQPDGTWLVALDRSPFYAESGGQVADEGRLMLTNEEAKVIDVQKKGGIWMHRVDSESDLTPGQEVEVQVNRDRRRRITKNHTATHLLQAALRKVLGEHVTQAGSRVGPEELRLDFTHGQAMSRDELRHVEELVNQEAWRAQAMVIHEDVPIDDARKMGAMALFGEKYGDRVRVVQVGDMKQDEPSFSRELCGGIHVRNTGEIGLFKIMSESSASSGVRRIVAVTGEAAYRWALDQQSALIEAADKLKSTPKDLNAAIDRTLEALKEEKRRRQNSSNVAEPIRHELGRVELLILEMKESTREDLEAAADQLAGRTPFAVGLVAAEMEGKAFFVVKAADAAVQQGAHAGNLVKALAQITDGGGGGRPGFATAGGRSPEKISEALVQAPDLLRAMIKG